MMAFIEKTKKYTAKENFKTKLFKDDKNRPD
jgi:hypothetical protein